VVIICRGGERTGPACTWVADGFLPASAKSVSVLFVLFVCLENKFSKSTYPNGRYFSFACVNSETHGASEAICFIVLFDFEGQMATTECIQDIKGYFS